MINLFQTNIKSFFSQGHLEGVKEDFDNLEGWKRISLIKFLNNKLQELNHLFRGIVTDLTQNKGKIFSEGKSFAECKEKEYVALLTTFYNECKQEAEKILNQEKCWKRG